MCHRDQGRHNMEGGTPLGGRSSGQPGGKGVCHITHTHTHTHTHTLKNSLELKSVLFLIP